jgi:hypothetical protein
LPVALGAAASVLIRAIFIVAIAFAVLFVTRLGGARRAQWLSRWPAVVFAFAAIFELFRGGVQFAAVLGGLAALSWFVAPALLAPRPSRPAADDPADAQARAILGVPAGASEADIRRAYRTKMAKAHPDQGGKHADAARLTGARDRLLRKR